MYIFTRVKEGRALGFDLYRFTNGKAEGEIEHDKATGNILCLTGGCTAKDGANTGRCKHGKALKRHLVGVGRLLKVTAQVAALPLGLAPKPMPLPEKMTRTQAAALFSLQAALLIATYEGVMDMLQPDCASPDSINDVCDAVSEGCRRAAPGMPAPPGAH